MSNISIANCEQYIHSIDNSNIIQTTKWKCHEHQVVIQTEKYFYKIYENYYSNDFYIKIREQLAKIYREKYNLYWEIITVTTPTSIFQIQKREKLKLATSQQIDFTALLNNWNITLLELEKRLNLENIRKQLLQHDQFKDVFKLKIIRDCVNKYEDYAITNNGHVILLDDSDFFIAMIDKNYNWLYKKFNMIDILTKYGNRLFTVYDYTDQFIQQDVILNRQSNKWLLFNSQYFKNKKTYLQFFNQREKMLFNNIKILSNISNIQVSTNNYIINNVNITNNA